MGDGRSEKLAEEVTLTIEGRNANSWIDSLPPLYFFFFITSITLAKGPFGQTTALFTGQSSSCSDTLAYSLLHSKLLCIPFFFFLAGFIIRTDYVDHFFPIIIVGSPSYARRRFFHNKGGQASASVHSVYGHSIDQCL